MIDLEANGFTKLTWEGNVPSPMPVPNVPYWVVDHPFGDHPFGDLVYGVMWLPNYDDKGNGGFFDMEEFDFYLTTSGKWCWDISVMTHDHNYEPLRPRTTYTYIRRIPSPLPEELLITVL